MKRVYEEAHADYLKEFLEKHLSSIIRPEIDFNLQAKKHIQYLDREQLDLLVSCINYDKISEDELKTRLSKLGFFSNINIYEKRAIYFDYSRSKLTRILNYNDNLIDYVALKEKGVAATKSSNLERLLIKKYKKFKKRTNNLSGAKVMTCVTGYDPLKMMDPSKPLHFNPLNEESIDLFFKPANMRAVKTENPRVPILVPKSEIIVPMNYGFKPSQRKITIYDRIDNPNIILRKKKSLYLEPSKCIDYHTCASVKFNDVSEMIKQLPNYEFAEDDYSKFSLKDFVNQVIFSNNNLPVPTESRYTDFSEFRKGIKGGLYFTRKYLNNKLLKMILKQDRFLSVTDAVLLASEFKRVLGLPALEYFYKEYVDSDEYKDIVVDRTRSEFASNPDRE